MQNLLTELAELFGKEEKFIAEGKILKNKVVEAALKLDPDLLKLLLKSKSIKNHFFQDIEGTLVFDKSAFQKFVTSKSFLPDSYTAFKNKIGLTVNGEYLTENKEVVLSFPYKDCVLEGGQTKEDAKRNEVFWNETLAPDEIDRLLSPKVFTNFKKYDKKGEHKVSEISLNDNLIIKGNNLLALHSLLPVYRGKIKLIYIDPPYNTGNDSFLYNDSFNHSTWLIFIKNRFEVAKKLLADDGFILIQIDNNEEGYLKILCDEIFGRNNYRNSIIVKKGMKSLQKQFAEIQRLNAGFDTILLYTKRQEIKLPNLFKELKGATSASWNNHWRGTDRPTMRYELFGIEPDTGQWRWEKKRTDIAVDNYKKLLSYIDLYEGKKAKITDDIIDTYYQTYLAENGITDTSEFELVRLSKNNKPEHYIPPRTEILLSENWMDLSVAGRITKFEHEKNEEILKRIIEWLTNKGDTVMDFFLGSGSTAAVSHKLERKYIGIEQINYAGNDSLVRLKNIIGGDKTGISQSVDWQGGGSLIYCELSKLNQNFINKINSAKAAKELKNIWGEMQKNGFLSYKINPKSINENYTEFEQLPLEDQKKFLIEVLDKNHLYVNYSEIEDKDYKISEEDKKLNKIFYSLQ